ncbi:helix-turn-helix transcriptional regulator [Kribbella shirazensis]|uniref:AraC-like DNA-binding protein n=1 Tax=Kribbella shirazensis TaxID=1105143 RepID=A0A7X5VF03_9ACTN|nr:AraC family transcriptional regulator [Kribbella shirazensis]NIK59302.1 AraC-like DNA-binding protein [Kribbella shirazensis]
MADRLELQDPGLPGVVTLGRYRYSYAHDILGAHSHPGCVEVCFLARGRQRYRLGDRVYQLSGGDQFVTLPDEQHDSAGEPEDKGVLYWLIVRVHDSPLLYLDSTRRRQLTQALLGIPTRQFRAHPESGFLLDDAIAQLSGQASELARLQAAMSLAQFLVRTVTASAADQARPVSAVVERSRQYVAEHLGETITVPMLSRAVGLSPARLHAQFRQELGLPPGEFILRSKIEHARTLLGETDLPVTEIAHSLGFASTQYFATAFKRLTRTTPTAYRRG